MIKMIIKDLSFLGKLTGHDISGIKKINVNPYIEAETELLDIDAIFSIAIFGLFSYQNGFN